MSELDSFRGAEIPKKGAEVLEELEILIKKTIQVS